MIIFPISIFAILAISIFGDFNKCPDYIKEQGHETSDFLKH